MDTSTRLDFLLGNLRVRSEEVSSEEWLKIIEWLLRELKPILANLNGFSPIGEKMNYSTDPYRSRATLIDADVPVFPEGFTEKTRCLQVAQLWHQAWGDAGPGHGALFISEGNMLLTQDGRWVRWQAKYRRRITHGHGFTGRHTAVQEFAEESTFSFPTAEELHQELIKYPELGESILVEMNARLASTIATRRNWLEALVHKHRLIDSVRLRLSQSV